MANNIYLVSNLLAFIMSNAFLIWQLFYAIKRKEIAHKATIVIYVVMIICMIINVISSIVSEQYTTESITMRIVCIVLFIILLLFMMVIDIKQNKAPEQRKLL